MNTALKLLAATACLVVIGGGYVLWTDSRVAGCDRAFDLRDYAKVDACVKRGDLPPLAALELALENAKKAGDALKAARGY